MIRIASVVGLSGCAPVEVPTEPVEQPAPTDTSSPVDTSTSVVDSGTSATTPPTDPDPYGMVSAHNAVRRDAQPVPVPPLADLAWDEALAEVAASWAAGCVWEHSTGPYGENLYVSSWPSTGPEAVADWASEVAFYDYATNSCSYVCGHYTQIVWRDTTRVGCGYADCPAISGLTFSGRMWVCNYDPPGNWIGERPY